MRSPYGFSWLIEGELAAMARPAGRSDFEALKKAGVCQIISLTPMPLSKPLVREFGFAYLHIPVADFQPPTPEQIDAFIRAVEDAKARGGATVVHCLAGKGRTGTMLSCYLVHRGRSAEEAVAEVRRRRPGSIETRSQEEAVRAYEIRIRGGRAGPDRPPEN